MSAAPEASSTRPDLASWATVAEPGERRSEISTRVGHGAEAWARLTQDVLLWRVKTRSGFRIDTEESVTVGAGLTLTFRLVWMVIAEPIEIVSVVRSPTRVGFSYRTRPGHPVDGEEVHLTVRSLTRAAPQQPWRMLFPILRIAQRIVRRRYLRALR